MYRALRGFVVGLTLVSFTACTTMRPMEDFTPSQIREQVRVGDRVSVIWRSGAQYDIEVTAVDADALHGRTDSGKQYKIMFEGIRSISVEKRDRGKTATGVAVAITTAVVGFVILLIRAWKNPSSGSSSESGSGS